MPTFNEPTQNCIRLNSNDLLSVDLETNTVAVENNGKSVKLGESLVYIVTAS